MSNPPYVLPKLGIGAFNCPYCNAYAKQIEFVPLDSTPPRPSQIVGAHVTHCTHCNKYSFWHGGHIIFPPSLPAPHPHADMPDEVSSDYAEARAISAASPKGAAALLRLCIQKLCVYLGEPGKDLNSDIASLVKKGLNPTVQKSLDIVRVIGNESVHPGTIDLNDNPDVTTQLFNLVNIIVETMISQPKAIQDLYSTLPPEKRAAIEARDKRP